MALAITTICMPKLSPCTHFFQEVMSRGFCRMNVSYKLGERAGKELQQSNGTQRNTSKDGG